MKVVILYRPNSELASSTQAYVREFARETGKAIELIDVDSQNGIALVRLHDVLQHPAILVLRDDGSFVQSWAERSKWPTVSELSFYTS